MFAVGKTHRGVFQMRSMGVYRRFFLEQSAMMPFWVSQGCWRFSGWVGDKENIRCLLKKVCFFADGQGIKC